MSRWDNKNWFVRQYAFLSACKRADVAAISTLLQYEDIDVNYVDDVCSWKLCRWFLKYTPLFNLTSKPLECFRAVFDDPRVDTTITDESNVKGQHFGVLFFLHTSENLFTFRYTSKEPRYCEIRSQSSKDKARSGMGAWGNSICLPASFSPLKKQTSILYHAIIHSTSEMVQELMRHPNLKDLCLPDALRSNYEV